jgi:hypothetical protein
MASVETS